MIPLADVAGSNFLRGIEYLPWIALGVLGLVGALVGWMADLLHRRDCKRCSFLQAQRRLRKTRRTRTERPPI
jgi:hypothetical protein